MKVTGEALLEAAHEAHARGDWQKAYELFEEAATSQSLVVPDLALFADLAYATGHLDVTITTWERICEQTRQEGDRLAASGAAVRVAMHLLFDTALLAPVRGWLKRAEQLLEGLEATPVHAWLAVVRNYERLLSGDFASARLWARRAIEVGTEAAPAAAALGRVAEARSLILEGNVSQGLGYLNEAGVAAVSGELDPLSTGIVYCELICGLQALAQYDLAEEWTEAMERWRQGQPVGSVHGRCRVHRAEILRLRGFCREAEREALLACDELRPYLHRELGWPLTELGKIRLRLGDIPGAEEAFTAAHAVGWDPQPGLSLVYLAQGKIALAETSIRDALENPSSVPSKELPPNTDLRRAPLLEAQVEIQLAAGELPEALAGAEELASIAGAFQSKALSAGAALAFGRVHLANGDMARARRSLEEAISRWNEIGAPYEAAVARAELAQVHLAEGRNEQAQLESQAARSVFEQIAARTAPVVVSNDQMAGEPPVLSSVSLESMANESIFRREGDYWSVVFEGSIVRVRDLKGLRYLARLLADPGQEFHVLELMAAERNEPQASPQASVSVLGGMDAGFLLDTQAKESYRRRLLEIEEDIEEARGMGNSERAYQAQAERDFLIRELARAVGFGGRDRRAASASERARAGVTRAIRLAMARIEEHHPILGQHLKRAIRTGTFCSYLPDSRINTIWDTKP